ncbi:hypothetical protein [Kitasatospora sp. NPDC002965]|uniref:hypothetical protein n=1 Tax=Kitasatospora sp. NPDC002965 TaxID=3154775 RepID=UPI0033B7B5DC
MDSSPHDTSAVDAAPGVAVYLRCYPFDATAMECHRRALEDLAEVLGLPEPLLYLDNGLRAADGLPALEGLLSGVAAGWIKTVLVPGPFVFSIDGSEVRTVGELLERHGCRVVELPARHERVRPAGTRPPVGPAAHLAPVGVPAG